MKSLQEIFEIEAAKPAIQIRELKPLGYPALYVPCPDVSLGLEIVCEEIP